MKKNINQAQKIAFPDTTVFSYPADSKAISGALIKVGGRHPYENESFFIEQSACTISWMIQTKQFRNILKKHGEELVDIGFWARFLICFPLSTQGNRYIQKGFTPDTTGYQAYCQRVREILEEQDDFVRSPADCGCRL